MPAAEYRAPAPGPQLVGFNLADLVALGDGGPALLNVPLFVGTSRNRKWVNGSRLVKAEVLAAGIRPDPLQAERLALFSGHSLCAGLAIAAEAREAHLQRHLSHASAEMSRRLLAQTRPLLRKHDKSLAIVRSSQL